MTPFALILILSTLVSLAVAQTLGGTPGTLTATPATVIPGEPFTLLATGCPGPNPVGADYSLTFTVAYDGPVDFGNSVTTPPSTTIPGIPVAGEAESFTASFTLDGFSSPTLDGSYSISAACNGNELGFDFVWFNYPTTNLPVISAPTVCNCDNIRPDDDFPPPCCSPGALTVSPTSVGLGDPFVLLATDCPSPPPTLQIGASWFVDFTVSSDTLEYTETFPGTLVAGSAGNFEATWTIPAGSPTSGAPYRVSANCIAQELSPRFIWFEYPSTNLAVGLVSPPTEPPTTPVVPSTVSTTVSSSSNPPSNPPTMPATPTTPATPTSPSTPATPGPVTISNPITTTKKQGVPTVNATKPVSKNETRNAYYGYYGY